MHLPRRTAVTVTALALTGALAGCSDSEAPAEPEIVDPAGAEPGVDEQDAPDAPAIDVEPTP